MLNRYFAFGTLALLLGVGAGPDRLQAQHTCNHTHHGPHDHSHEPVASRTGPAAERLQAVAASLPSLRFVENKGQWHPNVRYRLRAGAGATVFVEAGRLRYLLLKPEQIAQLHPGDPARLPFQLLDAHVYDMSFRGANAAAKPVGEEAFDFRENYFLGHDPSRWASGVRAFQAVQYSNLYAGIDLKLYGDGSSLKYDFIVHPKADVRNIRLDYAGVDGLWIDEQGFLHLQTSVGEVVEQIPLAYQPAGDGVRAVDCRFIQQADGSIGFALDSDYDPRLPLIIDPILVFSTLTGSRDDNWGMTATFDGAGALYSGGIIQSPQSGDGSGYPVTTGALQLRFAGGQNQPRDVSLRYASDMALVKYNPTGTRIEYATFIGGNDNEQPHSLIVNGRGELFLMGTTRSGNFPTTQGAFQRQRLGEIDIVVCRVSANGGQLLASTLIGGSDNDGVNEVRDNPLYYFYADDGRGDVYLDAQDNIYVASSSNSRDFPTTPNAIRRQLGGSQDAVVFKFNPTCTSLLWSTYIGGSGFDAGYSIEADAQGHILIGGGTSSRDLPGMVQGWQSAAPGGTADGFIYRIHREGNGIIDGTYVGTDRYDQVYFIELDGAGNVYCTGQTTGDFPARGTAYNVPNGKQFVAKLSPNLRQLVYSFRFGSGIATRPRPDITPTAFLIDECENIYVAGWGSNARNLNPVGQEGIRSGDNTEMPITPDAFQRTTNGSGFYLMCVLRDGQRLHYGTYFGGRQAEDHVDGGTSRFDKRGIVYHSVCANCKLGRPISSEDFPTTPGAWSRRNPSDNCNNGSFKFDFQESPTAAFVPPAEGCAPLTVNFQNATRNGQQFQWDFGDGSPGSTQQNPTHTYTRPGTYRIRLIAINQNSICRGIDTTFQTFTVRAQSRALIAAQVDSCSGLVTLRNQSTGSTYRWRIGNQTFSGFEPAPFVVGRGQSVTIRLTADPNTSCADSTQITVTIPPPIAPAFTVEQSGCNLAIECRDRSTGRVVEGRLWLFGDGNTATSENPRHVYAQAGTYRVTLILNPRSACPDSLTQTVIVEPLPAADFSLVPVQCSRQVQPVNRSSGANRFQWTFGDGSPAREGQQPAYTYTAAGTYTVRLIATGKNDCRDTATAQVRIVDPARADFEASVVRCNFTVPLRNRSDRAESYFWDFGNGQTSTAAEPGSVRFAAAGTYAIRLTVNAETPCPDIRERTVQISPPARARISVDPTVCSRTRRFSSQSENTQTHRWHFGEGPTVSGLPNPQFTYSRPGTYRVTYIANPGDAFCADTAFLDVRIPVLPRAAFLPEYTPCSYELRFRNQSTDAQSFAWNFGVAGQSTEAEPRVVFPGPGLWPVRLTADPTGECPDVLEMLVRIDTLPQVRALNDTLSCSRQVRFRAQTRGVTSLFWQFGDGNTSMLRNPTHTYAGSGRYRVTLIGRRDGNACADTAYLNLYIPHLADAGFLPRYRPCSYTVELFNTTRDGQSYRWDIEGVGRRTEVSPVVDFGRPGLFDIRLIANADSLCPDTVALRLRLDTLPTVRARHTPPGCSRQVSFFSEASGVDNLRWEFGDGNTSNSANPTYTYAASGRYTARLIGRRAGNACADTALVPVVIPNLPRASFVPQYIPCSYRVRLVNTSSGASTYRWDDGRGNIRTDVSPEIDFGGPGLYRISLTANPDSLCPDLSEIELRLDTLPRVRAQVQREPCSPRVEFQSSRTGVDRWRWEFGDGNTSTAANPSHTYAAPGTYTVRLIGTRAGNACIDTSEVSVTIPPLPRASFNIEYEPCTYRVRLINTSERASDYLWDLGPLGQQRASNVEADFGGPGLYEVTLIANPDSECPDLLTLLLRFQPVPAARATATPLDCSPTVRFGGDLFGGDEVIWDFGDGTTLRNVREPVHTYAAPGSYTARVTLIRTGDACQATSTVEVRVPVLPQARFRAERILCSYRVRLLNESLNASAFNWNFGFGSEVTTEEPGTITFPGPGTYDVRLTADPQGGCPSTQTQTLVLDTLPDIGLVAERIPCTREVRFRTTGTRTDEQLWTFGDGTTRRNDPSPTYTYAAAGTYAVRLIGLRSGCADTATASVVIPTLPRADFRINWSPCRSWVVLNSTSSGFNQLIWETGDGNVYENTNALRHTYSDPGSYEIRLAALSSDGCASSRTQRIDLYRVPVAAFAVETAPCSPVATLRQASQHATDYLWNFGDGRTSTRTDPQFEHTYSRAGSYRVSLVSRTAQGCADTTEQLVDVVLPIEARFRADTSFCRTAVRLTNQTTGPAAYRWDFGDGRTSTERQPALAYPTAGRYLIRLTTGPDGPCPRSDSTEVVVTAPRQPAFTAEVPACSDRLSLQTTGESPHFGLRWNLGDGTFSSEALPSHRYARAGTYTVRLTLDPNSACERTASQTVHVEQVPVAAFTAQVPPCAGELTLTNRSQLATRSLWSFGDGTTSDRSQPTHRYTAPGNYTIRLIAEGTGGCRDTAEQQVRVRLPAVADFSLQIDTCRLSIRAQANTQRADNWTWTLGDGSAAVANAPQLSHTYRQAGQYTVTLVAEGGTPCEARRSETFTLLEGPQAAFRSRREPCQLPVQFEQLCRNTVSYAWDFGDGSRSNEANPTHSYETSGTYTVSLRARSAAGCEDVYRETLRISGLPSGTWEVPTSLCSNRLQARADYGSAVRYAWYVNDTVRSVLPTLDFRLSGLGRHRIRLRVDGDNPCFDERVAEVEVFPLPVAAFDALQEPCSPEVVLRDRSTGAAAVRWTLSDGTVSEESLWTHRFPRAGSWRVRLTAVTAAGCADSSEQELRVGPADEARIAYELDPCRFEVRLQAQSTAGQTFRWETGDGTTRDGASASHRYAGPGRYTARLIVDGGTPCETAAEASFEFGELPQARFGAKANLCGGYLELNNSSSNGLRYRWLLPDGSTSDAFQPKVPLTRERAYRLRLVAISEAGCTDTLELTYELGNADYDRLSLPNVFTPNGDGINEAFVLPGEYWGCIERVMIFDRWGNRVFESRDLKVSWDGRYEGEQVPEGVFVVVIEIGGIQYVGTVTVLR